MNDSERNHDPLGNNLRNKMVNVSHHNDFIREVEMLLEQVGVMTFVPEGSSRADFEEPDARNEMTLIANTQENRQKVAAMTLQIREMMVSIDGMVLPSQKPKNPPLTTNECRGLLYTLGNLTGTDFLSEESDVDDEQNEAENDDEE